LSELILRTTRKILFHFIPAAVQNWKKFTK